MAFGCTTSSAARVSRLFSCKDEEDEHLYHSKGWCRELWIASLGLPAVLPPPEEEKDVKSALDAAQAEEERKEIA
jgi:hypothetical protein